MRRTPARRSRPLPRPGPLVWEAVTWLDPAGAAYPEPSKLSAAIFIPGSVHHVLIERRLGLRQEGRPSISQGMEPDDGSS